MRWPEQEPGPGDLDVDVCECDAAPALRKLARVAGSRVRSLSFHDCDRVIEALSYLDALPGLERLDVRFEEGLDDDPDVVDALATATLPSLRALSIRTRFSPVSLTEAELWPQLTELTLSIHEADALAVQRLFPASSALRTLSLEVDGSFDGSVVDLASALAELSCFPELERLEISGPLDEDGKNRLRTACPRLTSIVSRAVEPVPEPVAPKPSPEPPPKPGLLRRLFGR